MAFSKRLTLLPHWFFELFFFCFVISILLPFSMIRGSLYLDSLYFQSVSATLSFCFLILLLLMTFVLRFFDETIRCRITSILLSASMVSIICDTIFPNSLQYSKHDPVNLIYINLLEAIVWFYGIYFLDKLTRKYFKKRPILLVILLIIFTFELLPYEKMNLRDNGADSHQAERERPIPLSKKPNVFILGLDKFNSKESLDLLKSSHHFKDFQLFTNAYSNQCFTEASLNSLLHGYSGTFSTSAPFTSLRVLNLATYLPNIVKKEGYATHFFSPYVRNDKSTEKYWDMIHHTPLTESQKEHFPITFSVINALILADFGLLRFFPDILSNKVFNKGILRFLFERFKSRSYFYKIEHDKLNHIKYIERYFKTISNAYPSGEFHFMFLRITHQPYLFDENCQVLDYKNIHKFKTRKASVTCAKKMVTTFVEQLKAQGLYENSLIFLYSDHGVWREHDKIFFAIKQPYADNKELELDSSLVQLTDAYKFVLNIAKFDNKNIDEIKDTLKRRNQIDVYNCDPNPKTLKRYKIKRDSLNRLPNESILKLKSK